MSQIIKAGTPFPIKGYKNMFVVREEDIDPDKTYVTIDKYGDRLSPWLLVSNCGLSFAAMLDSGIVKYNDGVWQNRSNGSQVTFIRLHTIGDSALVPEAPIYDITKPKLLCQLQDIKTLESLGPIIEKTTYVFDGKEYQTMEEAQHRKSELAFARKFTPDQINFLRSSKTLALKYLFGAE